MGTVTISKKEYHKLLERALRYDYLQEIMKEDLFASPPTRNVKEVVKSFYRTGLYSQRFVKSLEKGLKRSSYFK